VQLRDPDEQMMATSEVSALVRDDSGELLRVESSDEAARDEHTSATSGQRDRGRPAVVHDQDPLATATPTYGIRRHRVEVLERSTRVGESLECSPLSTAAGMAPFRMLGHEREDPAEQRERDPGEHRDGDGRPDRDTGHVRERRQVQRRADEYDDHADR
jgi:hypothetical protein